MAQKQDGIPTSAESVVLTCRVWPDTAEAVRRIADRNYRSVSSHLRMLVEANVAENAELPEAA